MVLPMNFWLLFAVAMLISSIGFKNYVWFISLGYGFSIAGEGLLMLLLYGKNLTLGTIICCVLFIIYGCRLGGYLAYRELKSSSYKKNMTGEIKDGKTIPMGVKIAIWVTCAALYVTQVSGIGAISGVGQWIVVLIGYVGIIYVMFSGARRLEVRQNKNYGNDPEYQKYVTTVPILLPFVPLYSVEKHKWLVA